MTSFTNTSPRRLKRELDKLVFVFSLYSLRRLIPSHRGPYGPECHKRYRSSDSKVTRLVYLRTIRRTEVDRTIIWSSDRVSRFLMSITPVYLPEDPFLDSSTPLLPTRSPLLRPRLED